MKETPLAFDAYEALAEAYAAAVDTKPHNAYYERPATLSLLPEVTNKKVLDAGCGPGVYSAWLVENGAEVIAVDASGKMVELARRRLGDAVQIHQADLGKRLDFLESSYFDLVLSPLVLDYIEDWRAAFAEFRRVLRPGGHLVFSIGHPHFDYKYFKSANYFATELVGSEWKGFGETRVYVPTYRRPLSEIVNPLIETGFHVERILEPRPTEKFREALPDKYQELMREPGFLCVRARSMKPSI